MRRPRNPDRRRARIPSAPAHAPNSFVEDDALTRAGLEAKGAGRILLLACGALAHEVVALRRQNNWTHLDLHCLPAILHNAPDRIPDAIERAVLANMDRYEQIFVLYADCGTGGVLKQRCDALGVEMLKGPHCYSFFEGNAAFAARGDDDMSAFFLTDFLVRQFDAFVTRPLGLDQHPELLEMYFGNYDRLIYQAQTDDPKLDEIAQACAAKLGLSYERRFTGYGDLAVEMRRVAESAAPDTDEATLDPAQKTA